MSFSMILCYIFIPIRCYVCHFYVCSRAYCLHVKHFYKEMSVFNVIFNVKYTFLIHILTDPVSIYLGKCIINKKKEKNEVPINAAI